jgi:hypothetical protein
MKQSTSIKVLERHVTRQCCDFMAWRQWRAVRITRGVFQGPAQTFSSGEPGQCDYLFVRYIGDDFKIAGLTLVLWCEFKQRGDRRQCTCIPGDSKVCGVCRQFRWQERERQRGAEVWGDIKDLDDFMARYEKRFSWLHTGAAKGQMDLLMEVTG